MVPYIGKNEAKQYIYRIPIKFDNKMLVMAKPLDCCVQFRPYVGKNVALTECGYNGRLGLGTSAVAHLLSMKTPQSGSNNHNVTDNVFTSTKLVRYLQPKSIVATGTVQLCRIENTQPKEKEVIRTENRAQCDVAVDTASNMVAVKQKDNKIVNALFTFASN